MKAIILSIGDELTSGQTVDTNSAWLSRQLAEMGISTLAHCTVSDEQSEIATAITSAASAVNLLIISGGLGPTEDDLTRQALAQAMGVELVLDEPSLRRIEQFFRNRGRAMSESNKIQAMLPRGASIIPNDRGTAPGIAARLGNCDIYIMPGVPFEMKHMFSQEISPRLKSGRDGVILHKIIHTFGAGESDVGTKIADMMQREANPRVGTTVAAGMVSVRILSNCATRELALQMQEQAAAEVRRRLGELVICEDENSLPAVVGAMLKSRRAVLSTAESCTGGMIGQMITSISGSSDYYVGGVVAYANQVKQAVLAVDEQLLREHGAVSEPVAAAMAEGCLERFGSDYALSVTGIAGPGGGSEEKPVGLVYVGLAEKSQPVQVWRLLLPGTRDIVRLRASLAALNFLRLRLRQ